ncbi:MAG: tRNA (adenosine(37)-N6)-threonylcarbamoyltransferase complex dimerization subunit type 1 TsaB [bacterium]
MGKILCLDTATTICSVSLSEAGRLISFEESSDKNLHASRLTLFIEEVLKTASLSMNELDAIAVSMGPGSYTGLRIGVASAKGLCYALDIPLIAIPTLQAMALGMRELALPLASSPGKENETPGWGLCPMVDARRMEVFCAIFDQELNLTRDTAAEIIHSDSFSEFMAEKLLFFAGDGAEKCRELLESNKNAIFIQGFRHSSRFMIRLAEEKLTRREFENLAYFEPFYLKDFIAGKPRVKALTS